MDDDSDRSDADENVAGISKTDEISAPIAREPSPEMARISALITRPPKQKSSKQRKCTFRNSKTYLATVAVAVAVVLCYLKTKKNLNIFRAKC